MASAIPYKKRSNLQLVEISTGTIRWDASVDGTPVSIKMSPDGRLMGFLSGKFSRPNEDGQ